MFRKSRVWTRVFLFYKQPLLPPEHSYLRFVGQMVRKCNTFSLLPTWRLDPSEVVGSIPSASYSFVVRAYIFNVLGVNVMQDINKNELWAFALSSIVLLGLN